MADIFDLFAKIGSTSPAQQAAVTHLVVGLGNPGDKYTFTRHNTGFLALDYITQKLGIKVDRVKFKSLCGEGNISGKRVLFMKPQTFMNLSGEAVREAAAFYKIEPENILVICDDVNFDVGVFRIKRSGSDGGQRRLDEQFYEIEEYKGYKNIGFMLAPHAIYTCDEPFLLKVSAEAKRLGLGLNIHLSESKAEFNDCMRDHGCTPTEYVARLGLFENKTLAAHCVQLTENDIRLLAGFC